MALVKSFFLGAELLSRVLAGKVIEAEVLIEKEKAVVDQMNFFARHYYQLALCYLPFAKEDFNVTIQKTNEFMQFLQATGVFRGGETWLAAFSVEGGLLYGSNCGSSGEPS
jgi:hypothetical protein